MEGGGVTVSFCDTPVVSGEAKAFSQGADRIAVNVTAKLDFYFSLDCNHRRMCCSLPPVLMCV